jgi:hypothetical protein
MRCLFLSLISIAAAACAVDESEHESAPVIPVAKQSSNALVENAIARYATELNQLVNQAYVDGPLTRKIWSDAAGGRLLDYAARCMFDEQTFVTLTNPPAVPMTVPAHRPLGLGPSWVSGPLSPDEQKYLMACLLAHINVTGSTVTISVRGPTPALALDPGEATRFTVLEGAFYGELGDPNDNETMDQTRGYACWGPAYSSCADPSAALFNRKCTTPSACPHLVIVGPCEAPAPAPAACGPRGGDIYKGCNTIATSVPPLEYRYRTVITTYLEDGVCQ